MNNRQDAKNTKKINLALLASWRLFILNRCVALNLSFPENYKWLAISAVRIYNR